MKEYANAQDGYAFIRSVGKQRFNSHTTQMRLLDSLIDLVDKS